MSLVLEKHFHFNIKANGKLGSVLCLFCPTYGKQQKNVETLSKNELLSVLVFMVWHREVIQNEFSPPHPLLYFYCFLLYSLSPFFSFSLYCLFIFVKYPLLSWGLLCVEVPSGYSISTNILLPFLFFFYFIYFIFLFDESQYLPKDAYFFTVSISQQADIF